MNYLGKYSNLRLVVEDDASAILALRLDARLNKYLSCTNANIDEQIKWIRAYKKRENDGREFYFAIEDLPGNMLGTIRLYNIDKRSSTFTIGSWIMRQGSDPRSGVEALLAAERYAYLQIGLYLNHFDVRRANKTVLKFHEQMGAQIVDEDADNLYLILDKASFLTYLASSRLKIEIGTFYA